MIDPHMQPEKQVSFTHQTPRMKRRYAAEKRFRFYGIIAIMLSLGFLAFMMVNILWGAWPALLQTQIKLAVELPANKIDPQDVRDTNFGSLIKKAMRERFPDVKKRKEKRALYRLVSSDAEFTLMRKVELNPNLIGTTHTLWLKAGTDVDMLQKGKIDRDLPASKRPISDQQIGWVDTLIADGDLKTRFTLFFLRSGDSAEPEAAGILSALVGSFLTIGVCFLISFPIGILAAVYLEEFAPKNRLSEIIEININNLAAVPSIVFGLLGLAIFLNVFDLPRSSPLVGGMVLSLMTLPTIIIASRAALRAVPPSIREAALGLGASPLQTTFHHVAPLALPGMLTGAIIGMARALGDTAPLLMIGMVAFIVDIPKSILEPATALPVQVFLWADKPELGFTEKTQAAILVLLLFLVAMNLAAIILRKKFERRY